MGGDSTVAVTVIATATNAVVTSIPVPTVPIGLTRIRDFVVDPAGTFVYVATTRTVIHPVDANVAVIDTTTNTVVATPKVSTVPTVPRETNLKVAVHPAGTFVYANGGRDVIDTATNTVIASVPVQISPLTLPFAFAPNGAALYVVTSSSLSGQPSSVAGINTATKAVVASVLVGNGSFYFTVHPAGSFVYVANVAEGTVSVLDTTSQHRGHHRARHHHPGRR
jgi:YVTN family beta-propeller protein